MDNTRKQYYKEIDSRYQKHVQNVDFHPKIKEREKHKKVKYKQHIVVLDSDDRDKSIYPDVNHWVLKLSSHIKNAIAIRLIRAEYTTTESFSTLLINNQQVPIQVFNTVSAFISLNDYRKLRLGNEEEVSIFSQISPGIEVMPPVTNNFLVDPYAYVFNPIEQKLRKFQVKLVNSRGELIPFDDHSKIRIILTLAVYTVELSI